MNGKGIDPYSLFKIFKHIRLGKVKLGRLCHLFWYVTQFDSIPIDYIF